MDNEEQAVVPSSADPPPLASDVVQREKISPIHWLLRLFFRPGKFFEHNARGSSTLVVILSAYVFGAAWSLTYYMDAARRPELPAEATAWYVFGATLVGAVVGGAVWYFLAGTWYGIRLTFCRSQGVTWKLARRVFIFSEFLYALPLSIGLFGWWATQARWLLLVTMAVVGALMFWSTYVSYRGVRVLFRAARARAVVWFVVLPCILYAACFALPPLLENVRSRVRQRLRENARSHIPQRTVHFEDAFFSMERPANWVRVQQSGGPGAVVFNIPHSGSFSAIIPDPPAGEVDLEQTAQAMAQMLAKHFKTVANELGSYATWGSYSGRGLRLGMNVDGHDTLARIFCTVLPDGRILVVHEMGLEKAQPELEKQFDVVRKTLRVKPVK